MRKHMSVGCWSAFPSREESLVWAIAGLAVGSLLIALTIAG